jgi:hypothetical protein
MDGSLHNIFIIEKEDAELVGLQVFNRQLWHYIIAKYLVEPFVWNNAPCTRICTTVS